MTLNLLNCPFCGASDLGIEHKYEDDPAGRYFVKCYCCEMCGPVAQYERQVIQVWNEREMEKAPEAATSEAFR